MQKSYLIVKQLHILYLAMDNGMSVTLVAPRGTQKIKTCVGIF